jgi:hypothetical protein
MKALLRACLVALPFFAVPTLAHAWGFPCLPPVKVDAGVNAHFNAYIGQWGLMAQAGPWYSYFPYDAYFQTPAPVGGWPFWPPASAPAVPPGVRPDNGNGNGNGNDNGQSMFSPPRGIQPAGGAVPKYWYGR